MPQFQPFVPLSISLSLATGLPCVGGEAPRLPREAGLGRLGHAGGRRGCLAEAGLQGRGADTAAPPGPLITRRALRSDSAVAAGPASRSRLAFSHPVRVQGPWASTATRPSGRARVPLRCWLRWGAREREVCSQQFSFAYKS